MLLSTKQVADRLQVHPATIRRWAASGRLRYVRIGRERAIPVAEVTRLRRSRSKTRRPQGGGRAARSTRGIGTS
jgi:excisionase family DNA binding protein